MDPHLGITNLVLFAQPSTKIFKLFLAKQDKTILFVELKYWMAEKDVNSPKMVLNIFYYNLN